MADARHPFEPLPSVQEVDESQLPHDVPPAHYNTGGTGDISMESYNAYYDDRASSVSPLRSSSGSSRGAAAVGGSGPTEPDHMPLQPGAGDTNDYSRGFNGPLDNIHEAPPPQGDDGYGYGDYPGPRRGAGGSALWQQNRAQSRNMMWL